MAAFGASRQGRLSVLAASLFLIVTAIYFYIFIWSSPQHWSLVDDYLNVVMRNSPDFTLLGHFQQFDRYQLSIGRLTPLTNLFLSMRLAWLPLDPRIFHIYQFVLVLTLFFVLFRLMRSLALTNFQSWMGLFFLSFAFPTKDMLVYSTASETMVLLFFCLSLLSYTSKRLKLSFVFFVLMLFTKETSAALTVVYPAVLLARGVSATKAERIYLGAMFLVLCGFAGMLWGLPHVYTGRYDVVHVDPWRAASGLLVPVLTNYWPVILSLAILRLAEKWTVGAIPRAARPALYVGLAIVVSFNAVLAPWITFDHWWYLHIPIPVGWALVFAALWPKPGPRAIYFQYFAFVVLGIWGARLALIPSLNVQTFLAEAKSVAELLHEENVRTPGLKYYSNCDEAAKQLLNYLRSTSREVTVAEPTREPPMVRPHMYVESSRCGPSFPSQGTRTDFKFWSVVRNL